MNVTVSQSDFAAELSLLSQVLDKKETIPIISCVVLTAQPDGILSCVATNIDNAVTSRRPATVEAPGAVAVKLDTCLQLVKRFPAGNIQIKANGSRVTLKGTGAAVSLQVSPVEEFPPIPAPEAARLSVPAVVLLKMLGVVKHALTDNYSQARGGHCAVSGSDFALVATDGHQMAIARHALLEPAEAVSFTIGSRAWLTIKAWLELEQENEPIAVAVGERQAWFSSSSRVLACTMLAGQYPAYERVIPKEPRYACAFDADSLVNVLRRQLVLSSSANHAIGFKLTSAGLILNTASDVGSADDELPIEHASGDGEIAFALNGAYAVNAVEAIGSERVRMLVASERAAVVFRPVDDGSRAMSLIAPIQR